MDDLGELVPLAELGLAWLVLPAYRESIALAIAEHLGEYADHQALKDICLGAVNDSELGIEPAEAPLGPWHEWLKRALSAWVDGMVEDLPTLMGIHPSAHPDAGKGLADLHAEGFNPYESGDGEDNG